MAFLEAKVVLLGWKSEGKSAEKNANSAICREKVALRSEGGKSFKARYVPFPPLGEFLGIVSQIGHKGAGIVDRGSGGGWG